MDYPVTKSTPKHNAKNDIFPVGKAKKKNAAMQTSLFSSDALGSEISTSAKYAKKGKGGTVNKSVVKTKANEISPTAKY